MQHLPTPLKHYRPPMVPDTPTDTASKRSYSKNRNLYEIILKKPGAWHAYSHRQRAPRQTRPLFPARCTEARRRSQGTREQLLTQARRPKLSW